MYRQEVTENKGGKYDLGGAPNSFEIPVFALIPAAPVLFSPQRAPPIASPVATQKNWIRTQEKKKRKKAVKKRKESSPHASLSNFKSPQFRYSKFPTSAREPDRRSLTGESVGRTPEGQSMGNPRRAEQQPGTSEVCPAISTAVSIFTSPRATL